MQEGYGQGQQGQAPLGQQAPGQYAQAPSPHAQQPVNPNPAQTAGIILLACAALLAVGLFTKSWATASEGRNTIGGGLLGFEGCSRGNCESLEWDWAEKRLDIPGRVAGVRMIVFVGGLGALGGLAFAGGMALSRKTQSIPTKPIVGILSANAGLMTYFAISFAMSDKDVNFGPGYSAFLAIGSVVVGGIVSRKMLIPLQMASGHARTVQQHHAQQHHAQQQYSQPQQPQQPPAQQQQPPTQQQQTPTQQQQTPTQQQQTPAQQQQQQQTPAQQQQQTPAQQQHAQMQQQVPAQQQHAQMQQQAPTQKGAKFCPTCGQPLQFYPEHQRHYCTPCQIWV